MEPDATVREVMNREYLGVSESDTVDETASMMLDDGAEVVVVVRGSEPVGIMTERDALAAVVEGSQDAAVADAMTPSVPTVPPDASVQEAAAEMSTRDTQRLVVSDGDRPVGVVSEHDLITTSPFATPPDATGDPDLAVAGHPGERAGEGSAEHAFEDQSICEACGSFARDLAQFNGQLLCGDCRDI